MSTQLDNVTDTTKETSDPIHSHIVRGTKNKSGEALVTEARVMGHTVTAICGYTWVPSRNPENHPICQKCSDIISKLPI